MTGLTLGGCQPYTLLSHLAMYGLGAILEAEGVHDVRLRWTEGGNPRPHLSAPEVDQADMARLVGRHASARTADGSWVQRDIIVKGSARGLMSPRLSQFGEQDDTWQQVQAARHAVLNGLTDGHEWLDLRFIAALGEPCYWHRDDRYNRILQDHGVSRYEMQPRNQGSEFVANRLRKLASAVAQRDQGAVLAGLQGISVNDEIAGNASDSRTATGLAAPGPTDNALAWCALWGISQFPIAYRASGVAVTSGHLGYRRQDAFYVPFWRGPWRSARLRSMLASAELSVLAGKGMEGSRSTELAVSKASAWLKVRGVQGVIRFPVVKFGSDNAPERRAMQGEVIPAVSAEWSR
jgi:CRISPR-associated protein Csb3